MAAFDMEETMERTQWDFFWVPPDAQVVDRPELLYVSCPRDVPILNCVTRTRAVPAVLPVLVEEVGRAHATVRSRWLVRHALWAHSLEPVLGAAGWAPAVATHACVMGVSDYERRPSPSLEIRLVGTMDELRDSVWVIDQAFPDGLRYTEQQFAADLARCTGPDARVQRFVAYERHFAMPVATGCMTVFQDLGFGLLWAGSTVPQARGRGAYSALLAARIDRARELGLSHVGLYAITHTSAPIVTRQGFKRIGAMTYWERPAGVSPAPG
jgi:GNAT superfamily N-acetyltransferase